MSEPTGFTGPVPDLRQLAIANLKARLQRVDITLSFIDYVARDETLPPSERLTRILGLVDLERAEAHLQPHDVPPAP